jgi:hypothetical protein
MSRNLEKRIRLGSSASFQLTPGKINFLVASFADMFLVKLVRKYFCFFSTIGALADKGFQVLELLVTGTMQGSGHKVLLVEENVDLWSEDSFRL